MAYTPARSLTGSFLELLVERLRKKTMGEWIKLGVMLCGFAVVTWSTVQNLEYRMDKIEKSFDEHLDKHDVQYDQIQKTLTLIQIDVGRINKQ